MREAQRDRADVIDRARPWMPVAALLAGESRAQLAHQAISRNPITRRPVLEDSAVGDVGLQVLLVAPLVGCAAAAKIVAVESVEAIRGIRHRPGAQDPSGLARYEDPVDPLRPARQALGEWIRECDLRRREQRRHRIQRRVAVLGEEPCDKVTFVRAGTNRVHCQWSPNG